MLDNMSIDKHLVLRRADQVTFEVVAGEAILIDMRTGTYFSLNEVGTLFWEELDGQRSLIELAGLIADTYNEKSARFVRQLKRSVATAQPLDVEEIARDYGVETADVRGYLEQMKAGDPEAVAANLAAEFHVTPDIVLDDLLELAQKMMADRLLLAA
jgi:hypothetical protein